MKFRKLVLILIFAGLIVAYFTKPQKDDFVKYIQPTVNRTQIPPAVDLQDKILYTKVKATYIDLQHPSQKGSQLAATAIEENYIGILGRFWKVDK
jgi:hypothetical protein